VLLQWFERQWVTTGRYLYSAKGKKMTARFRFSGVWLGGLALVLVGLVGALGLWQDVRAAGNYTVSLQAPDIVRQFENAELIAVVKDSQGQPVNGIPVTFQVAPEWQKTTKVAPNPATTSNGIAKAVFEAGLTGVVAVAAQVGDTTMTTRITVTGSGSRIFDRRP
jgi:hypothetical protein